jgi:hypothetical protein
MLETASKEGAEIAGASILINHINGKETYMGYRSDVGLCLTNDGKKTLDAKLTELEAGTDKTRHIHELLNFPRAKREDQDSGAVAWLWGYLKWYADYEDVAFFEKLLRNLDYNDYLFIRLGESEDDTEVHGGFWDNPFGMSLVRGIVFD